MISPIKTKHCNIQIIVFLGCTLPLKSSRTHRQTKSSHNNPNFFSPFRPSLYTPLELLEGYDSADPSTFTTNSKDGLIYAYFKEHENDEIPRLFQRIHDSAIDDGIDELLSKEDRKSKTIGIMGGHSLNRKDPIFSQVIILGYRLAKLGYFVVTGGGPGAMEAEIWEHIVLFA